MNKESVSIKRKTESEQKLQEPDKIVFEVEITRVPKIMNNDYFQPKRKEKLTKSKSIRRIKSYFDDFKETKLSEKNTNIYHAKKSA